MARERKKDKARDKKSRGKADADKASRKGGGAGEAAEGEEKKPSKVDQLFWHYLIIIAVFIVAYRGAYWVGSPWSEILVGVQFLCPVVAVVLFVRAFPHPIRSMNKRLAEERELLRRETKRKKKKRGF